MRFSFIVPALVIGLGVSTPAVVYAKRNKPASVTPPKKKRKDRKAERAAKDYSEAGTRRGAIEFTLGSAAVVLFGVLIGRGAWEVVESRRLERECAAGTSNELQCGFSDPSRGHRVAAGLSFGFSVPMAIAAGFLYARGARVNRDYKAWKRDVRVRLLPAASPRGGGLSLRLNF